MKDPGELVELMNLVKACAEHGAAFPNINTLAMLELKEAEREAEKEAVKRKRFIQERDAKEEAIARRNAGQAEERPVPPALQPRETTDRPANDPILQRPDPARSIPNEGPNVQSSPHGRQDPPTQNTRDVAFGERPYPGQPDRQVPDGAASGQQDPNPPVPEVDRRV